MTGTSTLSRALAPLSYIDIPALYARYASLTDFIIYTILFVGISQATLGKHYGGRAGRAIAIGTGTSLAIAFTLLQARLGFNLGALGPYAASLVTLTLGVMTFKFVRHAGAGGIQATAIAYALCYFGIHAIAPEFYTWLEESLPLASLAANAGFLLALLIGIFTLIPHADTLPLPASRPSAQRATQDRKESQESKKSSDAKRRVYTAGAERSSQDAKSLKVRLKQIAGTVKKQGKNPAWRREILQATERAEAHHGQLRQNIHRLRNLDQDFLRSDEALLRKTLRDKYDALGPAQKAELRKRFHTEWKEVQLDKKLEKLVLP